MSDHSLVLQLLSAIMVMVIEITPWSKRMRCIAVLHHKLVVGRPPSLPPSGVYVVPPSSELLPQKDLRGSRRNLHFLVTHRWYISKKKRTQWREWPTGNHPPGIGRFHDVGWWFTHVYTHETYWARAAWWCREAEDGDPISEVGRVRFGTSGPPRGEGYPGGVSQMEKNIKNITYKQVTNHHHSSSSCILVGYT